MKTDQLTGERLRLRALEPEDLEYLYTWENDTSIWNISETLSPVSRFILKRYLENAHKDIFETKQLRLMIESTKSKRALGTIDLFNFDHYHQRAAIGILIAEKSDRRKGYAAEALKILVKYCREVLKLHQIYCNIGSENCDSISLFEKAGFLISGTKKEWNRGDNGYFDEHFLQLIL